MRRLFVGCFEEADKRLNNGTVDLISEERWDLAERLFDFALGIPQDLASKGEMKYYFLLNRCIARKFSGKPITKYLHSVDWTPFHPKYHFAVAVLEDRVADAETLMRTQAVRDEVSEEYFKTWPLLRDFRNTEEFQRAFKDIFGKDYEDEILKEAEREIKAQQSGTDHSPTTLESKLEISPNSTAESELPHQFPVAGLED